MRERVVRELVNRRIELVVTIERPLVEGDRHGFVTGWLAEVKRHEARITELGGAFEPWEFPIAPRPAIAVAVDELAAMEQERLDKEKAEPATNTEQPSDAEPSPTSTAGRE